MGLEMARRLGRPALVLCPTTAIQAQWESVRSCGPPADVAHLPGDLPDDGPGRCAACRRRSAARPERAVRAARPRARPHDRAAQARRRPRRWGAGAAGAGRDRPGGRPARRGRAHRRPRRVPPRRLHVGLPRACGPVGARRRRPRDRADRDGAGRHERRRGRALRRTAGAGRLPHADAGRGPRGLPRPVSGARAVHHTARLRARVARRPPRALSGAARPPHGGLRRRACVPAVGLQPDAPSRRQRGGGPLRRAAAPPAGARRSRAALPRLRGAAATAGRAARRALPRAAIHGRLDRAAVGLRGQLPAPPRRNRGAHRRAGGRPRRPGLRAHPHGHPARADRHRPRARRVGRQADRRLRGARRRARVPRRRPARRGPRGLPRTRWGTHCSRPSPPTSAPHHCTRSWSRGQTPGKTLHRDAADCARARPSA